jgi:hypothetical protein
MAFPTNPINGQVYKDKIYNSSLNSWKKFKMDWVEIWGPGKGNTQAPTTSPSGDFGVGKYLVEVCYTANGVETMSGIAIRTQNQVTNGSKSYCMNWIGTTVNDKVSPYLNDNGAVYAGSGSYSTGVIYRVSRWQVLEL